MTTLSELNAAWEEYRLAAVKAHKPGTLEDGLAARRAWIRFSEMTDEYLKLGLPLGASAENVVMFKGRHQ